MVTHSRRQVLGYVGAGAASVLTATATNQLAVALPVDEIVGDGTTDSVESAATLSYGDTEYAYVESTSQHPPGTYWDGHAEKAPLLYEDRREVVSEVVPVL